MILLLCWYDIYKGLCWYGIYKDLQDFCVSIIAEERQILYDNI